MNISDKDVLGHVRSCIYTAFLLTLQCQFTLYSMYIYIYKRGMLSVSRIYISDNVQKIVYSFDIPLKNSMNISRDQLIIPLKIRAR